MHINDWLTDERAQEVIENVQAVVNREAKNRTVRSEAIKVVCDTISAAQDAMDLAFAAGTLSTTACIAREDSSRYRERYNNEDAKKATVEAKVGLKKALEKASNLGRDNFKQLKQWLEKDENTSVNTVMFFERLKKEIKRLLKVTSDKIKHPGSLGANRKKHILKKGISYSSYDRGSSR